MSQFGLLDTMQKEFDAMRLPMGVQILGVNQITYESGNATACQGKDLPWLQETPDELVWSTWAVRYRDVIILDGKNRVAATFNLTDYDLHTPAYYDSLKTLLIESAGGK